MKFATMLLLIAASLQAQIGIIRPGEPPVSEALRQYLELTFAQVSTMTDLTTKFMQFQQEKYQRMSQVQREIAEEMQRESPDPMALGQRYLELEVSRRELEREQARIAEEVQKLYTPSQRTKVTALQEILRIYPMACEAVQRNLIPAPAPTQSSTYMYVPTCVPSTSFSRVLLPPPVFTPGQAAPQFVSAP